MSVDAQPTGFAEPRGRRRPAALLVTNVSKTYPGTRALDNVSIGVQLGTVHALIGGNGSGKSTLIKILAGVVTADSGGEVALGAESVDADRMTPSWAAQHGLRFVHQDLGLFEQLTIGENLFVGADYPRRTGSISWRVLFRDAQALLDRLEVPVSARTAVAALRPAERTLVAIARALNGRMGPLDNASEQIQRGVLVLDEPTARLPPNDADQLLGAMRRYAEQGQAIVFVSHHLDEVLDVADQISILRDGRLIADRRASSLDERELSQLIAGQEVAPVPTTARQSVRAQLLTVDGLQGGPVRGVSFSVGAGEVLGIAGLVGSGRTTILEMIFGAAPRLAGTVTIDSATLPPGNIPAAMAQGVGYVPEDRLSHSGFMELDIAHNFSAADLQRYRGVLGLKVGKERRVAKELVGRYLVRTSSVQAPLAALSGGNQQKVILARWLERRPRVLLLDEPTQGVDVGARAELHRIIVELAQAGACVVLVSSDSDELIALSDRILVVDRGSVVDQRSRESATRQWLDGHFYRTHPLGAASHDNHQIEIIDA